LTKYRIQHLNNSEGVILKCKRMQAEGKQNANGGKQKPTEVKKIDGGKKKSEVK